MKGILRNFETDLKTSEDRQTEFPTAPVAAPALTPAPPVPPIQKNYCDPPAVY